MNGLDGRTAVVTGGSSGIGRAIALALGRAGANVVVGSRNPGGNADGYDEGGDRAVVDLLRSEGRGAAYLKTDVTRGADVAALGAFAEETFGPLDIWVNNAGAMPAPRRFCDYSEEELDWLLATNSKGVWHGMRTAAGRMLAAGRRGAIVNVLSTAAIRPHANQSIYDISKAAAGQATLCAALEFGTAGIRVNAVCPTIVKTGASRGFVESESFGDWFKTVTTLGIAVETRHVAETVLFLASDAAATITGALLPIDSGESLGPPAAGLSEG